MEWTDDAIVLSARKHGENSVIAELFTREHGRHKGIVRGGSSRRMAAALQPGSSVSVNWRARLEEHLGTFRIEADHIRAAAIIEDRLALTGLNAVCAMASMILPEREEHQALYSAFEVVMDALEDHGVWPAVYVRWELGLLKEMGFGIDLSACAATGVTENLTYVSPKSGRAVSEEAAGPYKERLLPLPHFLVGNSVKEASWNDVWDGLRLTSYFLERRILSTHGIKMPDARLRLFDEVDKQMRRAKS